MAKVSRVLFKQPFYERGIAKYVAGQHYPLTPQTESLALSGEGPHATAEVVEIEMDGRQHARETEAANDVWRTENAKTIAAHPALYEAAAK